MNNLEKFETKDYLAKLETKEQKENSVEINSFVNFLNYCFQKKNNFFIDNFNKRSLRDVLRFYNQLKSNILISNNTDVFDSISLKGYKCIRFILISIINLKKEDNKEGNEQIKIIDELLNDSETLSLLSLINHRIHLFSDEVGGN